jgi:cell division protein ZapA (FtsZ GTPase activity inhibitor)
MEGRLLGSHEEQLRRLTAELDRVMAVLGKRRMDVLSTESLFLMAATLRSQIRKQRINPVFCDSPENKPRRLLLN